MGDIEFHTSSGWVYLDDVIEGKEKCADCGITSTALGAGYVSIAPITYYCQECLSRHI